jgi:hypothetical protein
MSQSEATILGLLLAGAGLFAVVYVWTAMALAKLFAKLGDSSGTAWIPVLNIVTLLRLGEVNPLTVLFLPIPVVQVIGIVFLVTAINTINRRFGLGAGMTVLGFAALPVWASVLGFGAHVPIGGVGKSGHTTAARNTSLPAPGPVWAPYVAREPEPVTAVAKSAARPEVPPVAEPVLEVSVSEPAVEPVLPAAKSPQSAWAPPPLITPSSRLSEDAESAPTEPANGGESALGDVDKTVVGRRRRGGVWYVTADGSSPVRLVGQSVLIGRNPASRPEYPRAQLIALADPDKTVSKTHAHLALADGRWSITDLDSTNGVYLVTDGGDEIEIEIGQSVEATESFRLGDLTVSISAEGARRG